MSEERHIQAAATGSFTGRVGHKAGGFISKKFFHPSNFKNQEKLWAAIEAKNEEEKRQGELLKKREEERRIELLKQEMYSSTGKSMSSSATGGGLFSNVALPVSVESSSIPVHEKLAITETKRRLDQLRASSGASSRMCIRSQYAEDVYENDHTSVWGSYFDLDTKQWGYACCKITDRDRSCVHSVVKNSI